MSQEENVPIRWIEKCHLISQFNIIPFFSWIYMQWQLSKCNRVKYNFVLSEGYEAGEWRDLVSEYTLLKEVNHPNVIKLLGACTQRGPMYVIVEYCLHGCLRGYLRAGRLRAQTGSLVPGLTQRDLLSFCWQIAKGMQYLTQIKVVKDNIIIFIYFRHLF